MTRHEFVDLRGHLPAIYRDGDPDDALGRLLRVYEDLLFGWSGKAGAALPGIAGRADALPSLFDPVGDGDDEAARTPARFVPWLATWLGFAPCDWIEPDRLPHVVAGIVPLHGRRGTRSYLAELLPLCFAQIAAVEIDEAPRVGLQIGRSRIGIDSLLAAERPFWFVVDIALHGDDDEHGGASAGPFDRARLERAMRAVIDFAKPAHTGYDLNLLRVDGAAPRPAPAFRSSQPPAPGSHDA